MWILSTIITIASSLVLVRIGMPYVGGILTGGYLACLGLYILSRELKISRIAMNSSRVQRLSRWRVKFFRSRLTRYFWKKLPNPLGITVSLYCLACGQFLKESWEQSQENLDWYLSQSVSHFITPNKTLYAIKDSRLIKLSSSGGEFVVARIGDWQKNSSIECPRCRSNRLDDKPTSVRR